MAPIDRITAALRAAVHGGIDDAGFTLNAAAQGARTDVTNAAAGIFNSGGLGLGDILDFIPGLGTVTGLLAGPGGAMASKAGEWVLGIASGWMLGELFSDVAHPLWLEIIHAVNDAMQTEIFDPQTAATLQAKGIISNQFGRSEAAGGNLAGDHYDKLATAAESRPDLGSLLDLLNRAAIDNPTALAALQHEGFPPEWSAPLLALRRSLLSGADIALARLRGNIDDNFVSAYSQLIGVDPADMDVLIKNTGEPPGPEELMEAVRRGFIDDQRFVHGILQSRVRDEWVDVLRQLQFHPMSISDAVRAVVENQLSHDDGAVIARQNGLEEAHFPILVNSWGRPLSHEQMLLLFHRGKATLDDVKQAMRESDLKNKYIDQAVELGRRLIPERTIVSAIDHGVLAHDAGVSMLKELGFNDADATVLVSLGTAQRKSTARVLSRSDIVSMYSDGLLKRNDARDHLMKLGYAQADAVELLDLSDVKTKTKETRAVQAGIQASFKAHHLTREEAISELVKVGIEHDQAAQLLDLWSTERGKPTRGLSQAQILKAGTEGIISVDDTRTRLVAEGLVAGDADILLKIHGLVQYTPVK